MGGRSFLGFLLQLGKDLTFQQRPGSLKALCDGAVPIYTTQGLPILQISTLFQHTDIYFQESPSNLDYLIMPNRTRKYSLAPISGSLVVGLFLTEKALEANTSYS